jgi:hypothetical protein
MLTYADVCEEVKELRHARQQLQARMLTYADVC